MFLMFSVNLVAKNMENVGFADVFHVLFIRDSHNFNAMAPETMETFENSGISGT